jgi:hypothetical protein
MATVSTPWTEQTVVAFLQALLTPIIAVLTVVIAVAQYRLAKAKLILWTVCFPFWLGRALKSKIGIFCHQIGTESFL